MFNNWSKNKLSLKKFFKQNYLYFFIFHKNDKIFKEDISFLKSATFFNKFKNAFFNHFLSSLLNLHTYLPWYMFFFKSFEFPELNFFRIRFLQSFSLFSYHGFFNSNFDFSLKKENVFFFFFNNVLNNSSISFSTNKNIHLFLIDFFFLHKFFFFFDSVDRLILFTSLKKERLLFQFFFNKVFWLQHKSVFQNTKLPAVCLQDNFEDFTKLFFDLDLYLNYDWHIINSAIFTEELILFYFNHLEIYFFFYKDFFFEKQLSFLFWTYFSQVVFFSQMFSYFFNQMNLNKVFF